MLVNLSGSRSIDLLSAMAVLAEKYSASLSDIQQMCTPTRSILHLLFTIRTTEASAHNDYHRLFGELSDAIKHYAEEENCLLTIDSISPEDIVDVNGDNYRVLLLGCNISAANISAVVATSAEYGFELGNIRVLSNGLSTNTAENELAVVELLSCSPSLLVTELRKALLALSEKIQADIFVQKNNYDARHRQLICFDMDSTLIDAEVIDELAKEAGVGEQVAAITESAMRGDIAFNESFTQRMALLEGLDESVLASVAQRLKLNDGVEKLLHNLNKRGYKTAILSGGFDYFGRFLQDKLGFDYVYANSLDIVDGKVTGKVTGTIVNGDRKAELLQELATKEGLSLSQVVAVGDGANDLPMIGIAGMGVAFRAKPRVKAAAEFTITHTGLDTILYLMGFHSSDIVSQP